MSIPTPGEASPRLPFSTHRRPTHPHTRPHTSPTKRAPSHSDAPQPSAPHQRLLPPRRHRQTSDGARRVKAACNRSFDAGGRRHRTSVSSTNKTPVSQRSSNCHSRNKSGLVFSYQSPPAMALHTSPALPHTTPALPHASVRYTEAHSAALLPTPTQHVVSPKSVFGIQQEDIRGGVVAAQSPVLSAGNPSANGVLRRRLDCATRASNSSSDGVCGSSCECANSSSSDSTASSSRCSSCDARCSSSSYSSSLNSCFAASSSTSRLGGIKTDETARQTSAFEHLQQGFIRSNSAVNSSNTQEPLVSALSNLNLSSSSNVISNKSDVSQPANTSVPPMLAYPPSMYAGRPVQTLQQRPHQLHSASHPPLVSGTEEPVKLGAEAAPARICRHCDEQNCTADLLSNTSDNITDTGSTNCCMKTPGSSVAAGHTTLPNWHTPPYYQPPHWYPAYQYVYTPYGTVLRTLPPTHLTTTPDSGIVDDAASPMSTTVVSTNSPDCRLQNTAAPSYTVPPPSYYCLPSVVMPGPCDAYAPSAVPVFDQISSQNHTAAGGTASMIEKFLQDNCLLKQEECEDPSVDDGAMMECAVSAAAATCSVSSAASTTATGVSCTYATSAAAVSTDTVVTSSNVLKMAAQRV